MEWSSVIVYVILIIFALAIIARITGQTLPELLMGITEWLRDKGEETAEHAIEI